MDMNGSGTMIAFGTEALNDGVPVKYSSMAPGP
jgi:hypothetical protein